MTEWKPRPTSSPSLRKSPALYQRSQRYLPGAEFGQDLKRRYYHLGVCRAYPPPNDEDPEIEDELPDEVAGCGLSPPSKHRPRGAGTSFTSTAASLMATPLRISTKNQEGQSKGNTSITSSDATSPAMAGSVGRLRRTEGSKAQSPSGVTPVHAQNNSLSSAVSQSPSLAVRPSTAGAGTTRSASAASGSLRPQSAPKEAPIAYRPYCTWPTKKSGTVMIPPNPKIIPMLESNNHFVQPNGPSCGGGGTDFSAHFASRPSYSFELNGHLRTRPSSASTAADMKRQLWKVQRDQAADWVPNERSRSGVTNLPSTVVERSMNGTPIGPPIVGGRPVANEEALDLAGDYDEQGVFHAAERQVVQPVRQMSSMDTVRASSAGHATRMLRLERGMKNTGMPPTSTQRVKQHHPNQVYVLA